MTKENNRSNEEIEKLKNQEVNKHNSFRKSWRINTIRKETSI